MAKTRKTVTPTTEAPTINNQELNHEMVERYQQILSGQRERLAKKEEEYSTLSAQAKNDPLMSPTLHNLGSEIRSLKKEINETESILKHDCFVKKSDDNVINVGDTVKIFCKYAEDDVDTITKRLVEPKSSLLEDELSTASPIGRAILKAHVGDVVTVTVTASGSSLTYLAKIISKS